MSPSPSHPTPERWKIEVNERYLRIIDLLIGLATACLILPSLFLREILGLKDEPIAIYLDQSAYGAVAAFSTTIALGVGFHYASAKWVKRAWGQPVRFIGARLELVLDVIL